jgi:hypothetical protein
VAFSVIYIIILLDVPQVPVPLPEILYQASFLEVQWDFSQLTVLAEPAKFFIKKS